MNISDALWSAFTLWTKLIFNMYIYHVDAHTHTHTSVAFFFLHLFYMFHLYFINLFSYYNIATSLVTVYSIISLYAHVHNPIYNSWLIQFNISGVWFEYKPAKSFKVDITNVYEKTHEWSKKTKVVIALFHLKVRL